MNFFDYLDKVQKKPEAARKRILFFTVTIIMAIIVFLWLNDLKYSMFDNQEKNKAPGPFSIFKTSVLEGVSNLKSSLR